MHSEDIISLRIKLELREAMKPINLNIYQLNEKLKSKKLVCFGAGKFFSNFLSNYKILEKKVALILDNNKEKYNTKVNINNQFINIISISQFCREYQVRDFIILITCVDFVSVYKQLQQIEQLNEVECCIAVYVNSMTNEFDEKNRYYPKSFRIYENPKIPKVIHYCWFGGQEIPEQNKKWMASWRKYCPGYEIIEWNEENYDITQNAYMYEAYQAQKWGFVPDYARLDIIYNQGGIYLDTDVEIIKSLDELLYQDAFAGVDGSKRISLGLGFGARPKFDLIKNLLEEYNERSFYHKDGTMNIASAPALQTSFFKKLGYKNNGEYQRVGRLSIYPEKVLAGKCNYTGKINPTENTFAIHHYDGSWGSEEARARIKANHELFKIFSM